MDDCSEDCVLITQFLSGPDRQLQGSGSIINQQLIIKTYISSPLPNQAHLKGFLYSVEIQIRHN